MVRCSGLGRTSRPLDVYLGRAGACVLRKKSSISLRTGSGHSRGEVSAFFHRDEPDRRQSLSDVLGHEGRNEVVIAVDDQGGDGQGIQIGTSDRDAIFTSRGCPRRELCFGDLDGERLEVEIAPVRKDDDGHPVRREALDDRPEAHRLAVVPGALASLPRARNQPKP